MSNAQAASALAGFKWGTADNPHGLSNAQRWCVRRALSQMMRWKPASTEARSIPPGPPGTDLKRLVEERPELGLEFHGRGGHVDGGIPGIVVGTVRTPCGIEGHAQYAERVGDIADRFIGISGVITRPSQIRGNASAT